MGFSSTRKDSADAQYEVSIFVSMLGNPTRGSMIVLKCVVRCLKGTIDSVNKLELDNEVHKHVVKLGWVFHTVAGLDERERKSQSSGVHSSLMARLSLCIRLETVCDCDKFWNG